MAQLPIRGVSRSQALIDSQLIMNGGIKEDVEPFHSRLFHPTQNLRNAVLLDQVQMSSHFGEQIMQTLNSHLREHLVKVS
jgi:hypothetical protein